MNNEKKKEKKKISKIKIKYRVKYYRKITSCEIENLFKVFSNCSCFCSKLEEKAVVIREGSKQIEIRFTAILFYFSLFFLSYSYS